MARQYRIPRPAASSCLPTSTRSSNSNTRIKTSRQSKTSAYDVYGDVSDEDRPTRTSRTQVEQDEDDIQIDSDNDEEIDEDEAFDEEDEKKWGDFFRSRDDVQETTTDQTTTSRIDQTQRNVRKDSQAKEDLLFSSEEESSGEDESNQMDLSELLMQGQSADLTPQKDTTAQAGEEYLKDFSEESQDDEDALEPEEGLLSLLERIRQTDQATSKPASKRSMHASTLQPESEFAVPHGPSLDLNDFLNPSTDSNWLDQGGFSLLQEQLRHAEKLKEKVAVDAPLPTRLQQRVEREVAYKSSSKEVSKWLPMVQQHRLADHLEFPLGQQSDRKKNVTSTALSAHFKPQTSMEEEIQTLLQESGMVNESSIRATEDLEMVALDPELVKQQREELQKLRALLFFQEQKLKRKSKIKSKQYHRVLKKQKTKQSALATEQDPDEERMELLRQRAEERATLRHKGGSKWAKQALLKEGNVLQTRQAISESLARHDSLMQKIHDMESSSDEVEVKEADDLEMERTQHVSDTPLKKKGLLNMKFMQVAMEREKKLTEEMLRDDSLEDAKPTTGRMQFSASTQQQQSIQQDDFSDNVSDHEQRRKTSALTQVQAGNLKKNKKRKVVEAVLPEGDLSDTDAIDLSKQRQLIELAFAEDNVIDEEFQVEIDLEEEQRQGSKKKKQESDALPGWGSWSSWETPQTSTDIIEKKKTLAPGAKAKSQVIISSRKDHKFTDKYTVSKIPYPYRSIEQYDASMRNPAGKEWQTTETYQKMTKPRIITQIGKVIDPPRFVKQPKDKRSRKVVEVKGN